MWADNASEFGAKVVIVWLESLGVTALFIARDSQWENGHVQSFIGKLSDELLNGEIASTFIEAQVLIGRWRSARD